MKRKFFFQHFRTILTPVLVLFLLFGIPSTLIAWAYSRKTVRSASQDVLSLTCSNFEQILNESTLIRYSLDENLKVRVALEDFFSTECFSYAKHMTFGTIMNIISTPVNVSEHIHSIYLYVDNPYGNVITSAEGLKRMERLRDRSWYESYAAQAPEIAMWSEHRVIGGIGNGAPEGIVTLYTRLRYINGVIIFNIRDDALTRLLGESQPYSGQRLLVLSEQGEVMFSSRCDGATIPLESLSAPDAEPRRIRVDGKRYLTAGWYGQSFHWSYYSLVPEQLAYQVPYNLLTLMSCVACIAILTSVIVAYARTRRDFSYVSQILDMLEFEKTKQFLPEKVGKVNAYTRIVQNITNMLLKENALKLRIIESQLAEEKAKIQALQSQLNPHFLQNTLEYINQDITSSGGNSPAGRMLVNVSKILRYSMNLEEQIVPILEEIDNTNRYVDIMNLRSGNRIRMIWRCPEELLEYNIPKLLLQPLVENAILHGLPAGRSPFTIRITLHERDHDQLVITVQDSGVGISRETRAKVLAEMRGAGGRGHVGLRNVYQRLLLMYKDQFDFRILSREGVGTVIRLTLPGRSGSPADEA